MPSVGKVAQCFMKSGGSNYLILGGSMLVKSGGSNLVKTGNQLCFHVVGDFVTNDPPRKDIDDDC